MCSVNRQTRAQPTNLTLTVGIPRTPRPSVLFCKVPERRSGRVGFMIRATCIWRGHSAGCHAMTSCYYAVTLICCAVFDQLWRMPVTRADWKL